MKQTDKIPFLDLPSLHAELEDELVAVFRDSLKTCRFIGGPMVEDFENNFAEFCDARYCIGVNSGTDALRFALIASGVKPGDTVITVPNTFIATTEAISQAGAFIDFVDIDEQTCNMDPAKLIVYLESQCHIEKPTGKPVSRRSGRPVTAIIPVHLYGRMADMDALTDVAKQYGLIVIEDACQAHGAEYFSRETKSWRKAGSVGRSAAFSFYPGKNLGACGEAGALTTNDEEIARKVRMLRDHGQTKKYYHEIEGYNGRLDAIQAGFLNIKLKHLPAWNESRRRTANQYDRMLGHENGVSIPREPPGSRAVYHLYIIRTSRRDELQRYLSEHNIETGLHYPIPLHLQDAYAGMGFKMGDFPVSEKAAAEILSLPMYPGLGEDQQRYTVEIINDFFKKNGAEA